MSIYCALSANAGVSITIGDVRLWIDALHREKVPGFSTLSEVELSAIWENESFAYPDAIITTHCHPDHYSQALLQQAQRRWPKARVLLPEKHLEGQELICGDEMTIQIRSATIKFFRLPHESKEYVSVPHYGLIAENRGDSLLTVGDCAVASTALLPYVAGRHLRLALLNFPWLTLRRGRRFTEQYIDAEHILYNHLPFLEDDRNGYRAAAEQEIGRNKNGKSLHILDNFLQEYLVK